jgi:Holliday junction resolvase RusA-like endonuclease
MTYTFVLTAPPPSVNGMYANVSEKMRAALLVKGKGVPGRVKTKAYRSWCDAMGWELKAKRPPKITGKVSIRIDLPRGVRGDCDNRVKATLDLLQSVGIVENDRQCDPVTIGRADVAHTTITIEPSVALAREAAE